MATQQCFSVVQNIFAVLVLVLAWTQSSLATDTLPVSLFVDEYCDDASPINPTVDVPLNTCIVTPGAWGIKASSLSCENGSLVKIIVYGSGACSGQGYYESLGSCVGEVPDPVAGFVVFCGAAESVQMTSTTTIAVATNILTMATGTAKATATTTSEGYPTPTASGGSDATDGSSMYQSAWSRMSDGERIGAIIALAVGIPSVIFAAIGTYIMCIRGG